MRAVRIHEVGGPDVLQLEELPTPSPTPGTALVRVEYAGVNFLDVRQRTGDYKATLPVTAGFEGAGVVEVVGPEPGDVTAGQRVAWQMHVGSYATHQVVPVSGCVPLPDSVDTRTGAAVALQGLTAHALACSAYPVREGETCLVHAAAGGVGGLLTQIARLRGARVIGVVSTPDKVERARKAGADEVVVSTRDDFAQAARDLTGGRGVDVVYDGVGNDTFAKSLTALRPLGYLILFGQASGAVAPFDTHDLAVDGGRYLTRATIGQHVTDRRSLLDRSAELFGWISAGDLTVHVGGVHPLQDAARAHEALESRQTTGKLLLETT